MHRTGPERGPSCFSVMGRHETIGRWQVASALWRAVEGALLGRSMARTATALDEAVACCGGEAWCDRCGATIRSAPMSRDARCTAGAACRACGDAGPFHGFVRLGSYTPPLAPLVRRVKRHGMHATAHDLGRRLGVELRARGIGSHEGWLVVPIPANLWRRLARGIDHAHVMASGVADALQGSVLRAMRMRRGARQAGLGRRDRWARGDRMVLRASARARVRGRSIVLVDDIRTTGATLLKARELLLDAGADRVAAAVACVADLPQADVQQRFAQSQDPAAPQARCVSLST